MLNDVLANTLNNLYMASKEGKSESIARPVSKLMMTVLQIMHDNGYIGSFEAVDDGKGKFVKINIAGSLNKCGVVKPRFPVKLDEFEKFEKRYLPAKNFGIIIVSTSNGIMTHIEAKEKKLGGRLIAYIY
ncbi:MAG: 30S ribosomal protein S8 [Nanoarchaeota archaeon]|nr:30S ribosomal protein S8 [Nanoarchaeota archaeon]